MSTRPVAARPSRPWFSIYEIRSGGALSPCGRAAGPPRRGRSGRDAAGGSRSRTSPRAARVSIAHSALDAPGQSRYFFVTWGGSTPPRRGTPSRRDIDVVTTTRQRIDLERRLTLAVSPSGFASSKARTRHRSTRGRPRRSRPPSPAGRPPGSFTSVPSRSPPGFRPRWHSSETSRGSSSPGSAASATSRSGAPRWTSRPRRANSTGSPARRRRWPEASTWRLSPCPPFFWGALRSPGQLKGSYCRIGVR